MAIRTNLYNNVTVMFPHAQIWLTGHSLGGGIAALLGTTFGAPVVAFESPGDQLAATRLHLPTPPGAPGDGIIHVYHTAGESLAASSFALRDSSQRSADDRALSCDRSDSDGYMHVSLTPFPLRP